MSRARDETVRLHRVDRHAERSASCGPKCDRLFHGVIAWGLCEEAHHAFSTPSCRAPVAGCARPVAGSRDRRSRRGCRLRRPGRHLRHRRDRWSSTSIARNRGRCKYFGSVAAFTPLGAPVVREPGSIDVGLEVSQVPHLSTAERTGRLRRRQGGGSQPTARDRAPARHHRAAAPLRDRARLGPADRDRRHRAQHRSRSRSITCSTSASTGRWARRLLRTDRRVSRAIWSAPRRTPRTRPDRPTTSSAAGRRRTTRRRFDHVALHLGAGYQMQGRGRPDLPLRRERAAARSRVPGRRLHLQRARSLAAARRGHHLGARHRDLDPRRAIARRSGSRCCGARSKSCARRKTTAENDDLLHLKAVLRYRVR